MKPTLFCGGIIIALALGSHVRAQTGSGGALSSSPRTGPFTVVAPPHADPAQGRDDDPAYKLYSAAYNLVLDERWEEAREKFRELISKHPESEYRDDAEYWTAYSYRQKNRKKAIEAYKKFLKSYKNSTYFDDALADLDALLGDELLVTIPAPDPHLAVSPGVAYVYGMSDDSLKSSSWSAVAAVPALTPMLKIRNLQRMLHHRTIRGGYLMRMDEDLDPDTRMKLETIQALVKTGEDPESFDVLGKIALDQGEPEVLRVTAIDALSEFDRGDPIPIYVDIARNDTSEEMQLFAIDYIGAATRDKNRAFDVLMEIYEGLPASKPEKRRMVFYSIAEIGNDRAIDFLTRVARSHGDYELRMEARHYLGTIGGEKARSVLIELLKEK